MLRVSIVDDSVMSGPGCVHVLRSMSNTCQLLA